MENRSSSDDRSYRRGLLLGLTMAEVVILLFFALLLVWMTGIQDEDESVRRTKELMQQVQEQTHRAKELKEEVDYLSGGAKSGNQFDDIFRELKLEQEKAATLGQSAKLLQELGKQAGVQGSSPEQIAEGISERVRIAGKVIDAAKASPLSAKDNLTDQQLAKTIDALMEVHEGLESAGLDPKEASMFARQTAKQMQDKDLRLKSVEGRLRNAARQLEAGGRGTEKPACWANPETGKPEYIFDVALKSKTLVVHDNALPHRHEEQASLPLQGIRFDKDLGLLEFRDITRALFSWSVKEGCRFFVRVFDITQSHEKDRYKLHLRMVGEHFYYYEELNTPWNPENAEAVP